jgi:hypothetical protein
VTPFGTSYTGCTLTTPLDDTESALCGELGDDVIRELVFHAAHAERVVQNFHTSPNTGIVLPGAEEIEGGVAIAVGTNEDALVIS